MLRKLLISLLVWTGLIFGNSGTIQAQTPCTHFASNSGGGDGSSQGSPFQISDFWGVGSLPGKVLCLLDGTYVGDNSMINPGSTSIDGSSGSPITIRALNDGQVVLNGQGARIPINLNGNSWFVIEGMNAHDSSQNVVNLTGGSNNNIIRRVVAWDSAVGNFVVFENSTSDNNLYEDNGCFGRGIKCYEPIESNFITYRRNWGEWSNTPSIGPKLVYSYTYNSHDTLLENNLGTWDQITVDPDQPMAILGGDGQHGDFCARATILGTISYVTAAENVPDFLGGIWATRVDDCIEFTNNVSYIEPGTHTNLRPFFMSGFDEGEFGTAPFGDRVMHNNTGIGTHASFIDGSGLPTGWDLSNNEEDTSVGAVSNIWNGGGSSGARVCFRYVDGTLTSTPLWPWPMNQRIIDATSNAGHLTVDVTATMEAIFGTIPSECLSSGTGTNPLLVLEMGLDENTGTTPQDSSGLANHGSFGSGVTWTASGKYNNALVFDGTAGVMTVLNSDSLNLSDGMTLEAWFYPTASHTDFRGGIVYDYAYYLYPSSETYCGAGGILGGINPTGNACYSAALSINTWTHVAVTFDSSTLILYINGTPVTTQSAGLIPSTTGDLFIGSSPFDEFFEGRIDEIRIYNYARSEAEIVTDMNTSINAVTPAPGTPSISLGASSTALKFGASSTALKLGVPTQ